MLEEVIFLPFECVVGHDLDEEGSHRVTHTVYVWLFYAFGNTFSD
jgi:hypothetical protein